MLSAQASKSLNAEAEFGSFRWDGTVVDCPSFYAEGPGVMRSVDAQGLSIDIGLGRVRERVVELRNARVNQIDLQFDLRGDASAAPRLSDEVPPANPSSVAKSAPWYDRFVPDQVELSQLKIDQSSVKLGLKDGPIEFAGTRWEVEPDQTEGSYRATGQGGVITFPWKLLPPFRMDLARIRYQDGSVFLTDSDFRVYDRGVLRLAGEASIEGAGFSFDGTVRDVMANEVLPPDWSQRVEGRMTSDFTVANRGKGLVVDGDLEFADGVLTGLPVLDSLGAYGGNPRFRRLVLSEAKFSYSWEDGRIVLSDIAIGAEGLIQVEGRLIIEKDRRIDGRFQVGLTPGTLAKIPGAETKVFFPGERGLLWTSLHVTGTLDDPKEDLTDRLITAAGMRMFEILPETGERVLKFTRTALSSDLTDRLTGENGVIRQGEDLLDAGKGIINGDSDMIGGVGDVIGQGEELIDGVSGIFGIFGSEDKKQEQTDRVLWASNTNSAKRIHFQLLAEPVDQLDEIEDYDSMRFGSYTGGTEDWIYRKEGLGSIDGAKVLLMSPEALKGTRIVLMEDGSVQQMTELKLAPLLKELESRR